jgi:dihydroflavonol-4-reductase
VFGAGDRYRQSSSILSQIATRRVGVAVEGGINCVHIADIVDGHMAALRNGRAGERYILGGENLSHLAILQLAAGVVGVPAPTTVLPGGLLRVAAGPAQALGSFLDLPIDATLFRLAGKFFFYNRAKAVRELGLEDPRPVVEAMQEAWAWFQRSETPKSTAAAKDSL